MSREVAPLATWGGATGPTSPRQALDQYRRGKGLVDQPPDEPEPAPARSPNLGGTMIILGIILIVLGYLAPWGVCGVATSGCAFILMPSA